VMTLQARSMCMWHMTPMHNRFWYKYKNCGASWVSRRSQSNCNRMHRTLPATSYTTCTTIVVKQSRHHQHQHHLHSFARNTVHYSEYHNLSLSLSLVRAVFIGDATLLEQLRHQCRVVGENAIDTGINQRRHGWLVIDGPRIHRHQALMSGIHERRRQGLVVEREARHTQ
jgi:hypothetical protein